MPRNTLIKTFPAADRQYTSQELSTSYFSLQFPYIIKQKGNKNKESHQLRKLPGCNTNSHSKHFKEFMAKVMENPLLGLNILRLNASLLSA